MQVDSLPGEDTTTLEERGQVWVTEAEKQIRCVLCTAAERGNGRINTRSLYLPPDELTPSVAEPNGKPGGRGALVRVPIV